MKNPLKTLGLITDEPTDDADEGTTSEQEESTPALTVSSGNKNRRIPVASLRPTTTTTAVTVAPDDAIVSALSQAVAASTVKGYDEFTTLFNAMEGMPDAQRYTASLKALQASQKITPAQVIQSIQNRLALLDKERQNFEAQYAQQVAQAVTNKQQQSEAANKQIEELRAKIQQLQTQQVSLAQEAGTAQVQLETEHATFSASYEVVRSQLETEQTTISGFVVTPTAKV